MSKKTTTAQYNEYEMNEKKKRRGALITTLSPVFNEWQDLREWIDIMKQKLPGMTWKVAMTLTGQRVAIMEMGVMDFFAYQQAMTKEIPE